MNPYGQPNPNPSQYPQGYGYQQPQQYAHAPPPLPPMRSSMGAPPMLPGPPMHNYHPAPPRQQLPHPGPSTQARPPIVFSNSGKKGQHKYTLVVEQQPQRARMCGFGDKDRRPITPPPCIRLIITDLHTGQEVDCEEFDGTFFVLQVDLWDEHGHREVNIVRASSSSPAVSISTATMTSFPPTPERPMLNDMPQAPMYYPNGQPYLPQGYAQAYPTPGFFGQPGYPGQPVPYMPSMAPNSNTMFTRNLIGSLTVNASKLQDTTGKFGFWFVLQDLSVRTEGFFRLKMNFIDVGNGPSTANGLNKGRAPVLAWVFSEKFQVYSAKKFPGVIESTPLSKCFAGQGIKIPIRKDVKSEGKDDDDD
ncbi:hypothetical protein LTR36_002290 [Oleoguttula mirabilis]|uniref:Velvet domain-containing protein n=1 Tax=Oleoguttula mirabilis TaxID=1507867 RepID=A0AAV9JLJ1_9PEZI|nr:hypothetical protein LTR36_002290 [Oleoguttula mirabilis]